ncbi:hypothetical protein M433DRAFT_376258 [Acidomyces richmondensis BFW]|nr:MAG: hypothetical protein FE78DRAFT_287053 [Acidomyces sp. 'richmondensis']KYG48843.1 hypothetical protein M433DRAFT_376258 [Acidomyces richmondensis BFW]
MGIIKGGVERLFQTFLYLLLFCCAGIILGIYSYFLSALADRNEHIPTWEKAVEGLSGSAALYLICATLLTCCLGGISFFAFVAIVLDLCFSGSMIAIAVMTRHGANKCTGIVNTPLGIGYASASTGGFGSTPGSSGDHIVYGVDLGTACRLNTAAFAVSIIAAFLFLCTAAMQVTLVRRHKKEKRYGPSPSNNYTSGYGKRRGLFARKNKNAEKDAEIGAVGAGAGAAAGGLTAGRQDTRPSHDTGYTGSTVAAGGVSHDKVEGDNGLTHSTHGGYYTQPQGTGVNPYGYENSQPTPNE